MPHATTPYGTGRAARALPVAVGALVILAAAEVLWTRCGFRGCPDVSRLAAYAPGGASVLFDRYGERFADLAPFEYAVIPLDSLPVWVPQSFIAVEDRRFYGHHGVDWVRVFGALRANLRAGGPREGSSTIPMQLARTLFPERIPGNQKSLSRKLLEIRVASEIEDRFSKKDILELYLNHVYFGAGLHGIQSASHYYFGRDARALKLEEAALLAGLLKAPSHYDPRAHPAAARERRDRVLTLMADQGYLSADQAKGALHRDLVTASEPNRDGSTGRAPWFVRQVRRVLEDRFAIDPDLQPLRIRTTIDPRVQESAERELDAQFQAADRGAFGRFGGARYDPMTMPEGDATEYLQGAAVILDVKTGDVLAWVGGRDYRQSQFDRAMRARRQAGSAFKPFVYAAAIEDGFAPSQPILDGPVRFAGAHGEPWEPRNYSGRFEGVMSLREALVRSQNVPAIRLAAAVGSAKISDFARRAGIEAEIPPSPVAALGVTAVSPLEIAAAYSAFPGGGARVDPRFVTRIEDSEGRVLGETPLRRTSVTQPPVAWIVSDMLQDVVVEGTGSAVRRAGFYGPAAGKTGTTDDATDAWFVGFTPDLVGAVWIGFDDSRPMPPRTTGGSLAAPVWGRMMAGIYRHRAMPEFGDPPAGVVERWTDPESGLVLEDGCHPVSASPEREFYLATAQPASTCPHNASIVDRIAGWFGSLFTSHPTPYRSDTPGNPDPDLGVPRLPTRSPVGTR
jgi:1A family penicillin-binding protein